MVAQEQPLLLRRVEEKADSLSLPSGVALRSPRAWPALAAFLAPVAQLAVRRVVAAAAVLGLAL